MKKLSYLLLSAILLMVVFTACEKNDELETKPELPGVETMVMDFSQFKVDDGTMKMGGQELSNFAYSAINVGFWNVVLNINLVVPVAAFTNAFNHEAENIGENMWEWTYTINGFGNAYKARLTGLVQTDGVQWEMYIAKEGIGAFDEVNWFSGFSAIDGMSGNWLINTDPANPHAYLEIDWQKTADKVGSITYTYVQEMDAQGVADKAYGSYITMELQEGEYDAKFDIHVFGQVEQEFVDIDIEWSTTAYFGRVMSPNYFQNDAWHCWDSQGLNVDCE